LKLIATACILIIIVACQPAPYPKISAAIQNTDSIVINFFEPGSLKATKQKITIVPLGINKIKDYINDGSKGVKNTCATDGVIAFYQKNKPLLKATLQYRNNCWQINTEQNGSMAYIALPAEGKTFFEALEKEADKNEIILNF
jgi:hypothetical protein